MMVELHTYSFLGLQGRKAFLGPMGHIHVSTPAGQRVRRRQHLVVCESKSTPQAFSASPGYVSKEEITSTRERDYGSLDRSQYGLFVQFFRQASPYIEGHRGRTFVIAIPGEVVDKKEVLYTLLEDVALLHGLGVKLVLVVGARVQINEAIRAKGIEPRYVGGYRVTDDVAMRAAVAAAGAARMEVEARLSKGPTVTMLRRHERSSAAMSLGRDLSPNYAPGLTTVSGNYVAAKRKGVVNGIDYQHTGVVRFVQRDAVKYQLDIGNVILLSNLGYSTSGEVLNCDTYTVAVRAAIDLEADKLIISTVDDSQSLKDLPAWLPLREAESLLQKWAAAADEKNPHSIIKSAVSMVPRSGGLPAAPELDFDHWYELGLPLPLLSAYTVCRAGVKRAHIIDANQDGSLVLELYSRDGVGTMVSTDFYEGIRPATPSDLSGIEDLLAPLVEKGVLVARSQDELAEEIPYFTVLERESKILACATVKPLGVNVEGKSVAELAAFCVHPDYRGGGKGDSLLEYLERHAKTKGIDRLILLTTRTADWFEQRGFSYAGKAHSSDLLPDDRRDRINPARNSQLYTKILNG